MRRVLASSAERRLKTYRRQATLDLFTHHGPFWEAVAHLRGELQVAPGVGLPRTSHFARAHFPPDLDPTMAGTWDDATRAAYFRWKSHLAALHDDLVPTECRVEGQGFRSVDFWEEFLSGCVLFDPVPSDLLGFADAAIASYGDFHEGFDAWAGDDDDDFDGPAMLAPPIRILPNANAIIAEERARHDRIVNELHRRLEAQGIDIHELVSDIEYWDDRRPKRPIIKSRQWCIVVEPETTEEDVRNAFRILTAYQPRRPRPAKPPRDPLTCVQCAVWYDECGWSHERIAQRFDWAVQETPDAKPRCETARAHIAEGREILRQRSASPHLWKHEWPADHLGAAG